MGASMGGPWGALIGGVAGIGIGGFAGDGGLMGQRGSDYAMPNQENFMVPGYDAEMDRYRQLLAAQGQQSGRSGFRYGQERLRDMLMSQAQGKGPGQQLARAHAEQMADRGAKQQMAMAASRSGGMGALAGRNAAMAGADIQSRAGEQAMMGGLKAQLGATSQLGQVLAQGRGQDISQSQFNANLAQQREMELLRQRLGLLGMQQQGGQAYEGALTSRYGPSLSQPTSGERSMGMLGGGFQSWFAQNAGRQGQQGQGPQAGQNPASTAPYQGAGSNPYYGPGGPSYG